MLFRSGNILGAILTASNTYNNAKKIKKKDVKEELKGIVKESGNLRLEVIADDMYFNPWESEYDLKTTKKVTVEVIRNTQSDLDTIKKEITYILERLDYDDGSWDSIRYVKGGKIDKRRKNKIMNYNIFCYIGNIWSNESRTYSC